MAEKDAAVKKKKGMSSKGEELRAYWLFILPGFIMYFVVMAFPTVFSLFLSISNYAGGALFGNVRNPLKIMGFKAYKVMFADQYFYLALKNNLLIVFISVFGQIPLGFLMAYLLHRGMVKFRDFFQTIIYLPCVISTVVIGILWKSFFAPNGAFVDLVRIFNPAY